MEEISLKLYSPARVLPGQWDTARRTRFVQRPTGNCDARPFDDENVIGFSFNARNVLDVLLYAGRAGSTFASKDEMTY